MIGVLALTSAFAFTAPGGSLHRGLFGHDAAIRNPIGHDAAIDAFRLAAEALSLAANRLPNFYSSKQGMTPENPAVFGGGGTALLSFADSLQDADDISDCSDDLHFAGGAAGTAGARLAVRRRRRGLHGRLATPWRGCDTICRRRYRGVWPAAS